MDALALEAEPLVEPNGRVIVRPDGDLQAGEENDATGRRSRRGHPGRGMSSPWRIEGVQGGHSDNPTFDHRRQPDPSPSQPPAAQLGSAAMILTSVAP
jgi:hypothetical protein